MGMSASNTVFVGFPIVSELIGPAAAIAMTLGVLVENLLVLPIVLLAAGRDSDLPGSARCCSRCTLARNPIIWAIVAGVGCSALELRLPYLLDRSLQIVGSAAPGVALLMIGGVLVGQRLQDVKLDLFAVVGGKLLLHPLCVLTMLLLLPSLPAELRKAAILYAGMPMPALFSALAQRWATAALPPRCWWPRPWWPSSRSTSGSGPSCTGWADNQDRAGAPSWPHQPCLSRIWLGSGTEQRSTSSASQSADLRARSATKGSGSCT